MPPHARMSLTQQLLVRALIAQFWKQPWGGKTAPENSCRGAPRCTTGSCCPTLSNAISKTCSKSSATAGYPFQEEWFAPHFEFRFPAIGSITRRGIHLELRHALEPWNVLGEETSAGGTARNVDSSVERLQVKVTGMIDERFIVLCNGRRVPLHPTGTPGEFVAGVRYRAWQPPSCLHPNIPVHTPLVFDIVDTWSGRAIGGCTYHVSHPGGRANEQFPVNAMKRRAGVWLVSAAPVTRRV